MLIFVLHGFASATPNNNSRFLEKLFPEDTVIGLNYDATDIDNSMDRMKSAVRNAFVFGAGNGGDVLFVGASLGGFIAQHLAKEFAILGAKAVLINPAVIPWESLTRWLGKNTNYKTGEEFDLTTEDINAYAKYYVKPGAVPTLVLLDKGDEVLDSTVTAGHFEDAAVIEFEGGSHRFDHLEEAGPEIVAFMNYMTM